MQCTRKWVETSFVVDGPFAVGPADLAVWGTIAGQMGERDAGNVQIVSG